MSLLPRSFLLALAVAAPIAAQRPIPYPVDLPSGYQLALENGTRTPSGAPGPNYWTDDVDYVIDAAIEPASATVSGRIEMTYTNRSPEPLGRLAIHFRQNLHKEGVRRTRSNLDVTGGVTVENVTVAGDSARMRIAGTVGFLGLPDRLPPGESVTVAMDFSFRVPRAGRAPRMGHEENHVFYLGYWYPQFAVRDDVEGWVSDQYLGNGEFYMPYGNYSVNFTAPADWLVRSTGVLTNASEVLPDTALARLEEARSTREIQNVITRDDLKNGNVTKADEGTVTWQFRAENVRDVAVSISDRYLWDATHAVVEGREAVEIHSVYEVESPTWPRSAEYARHTIEWMSANVYPYPWPHMTACEGIIGGGMEYPMMTVIGDYSRPDGLQSVTAHELIHMWFPMIAGSNEKRHSWMDEGTTSFFTDLVRDDFFDRENRRGSIFGYVGGVRRTTEGSMMTHADYYQSGYGFASYTKPAALLHQLRGMLMDGERDVMMEAVRTYVSEWAFKHPSPYDMWSTFERFAGRDMDHYWRSWYFETWKLDHAIGDVRSTRSVTRVTIEDRGRIPQACTIRATYEDGSTEEKTIPVSAWLSGATEQTLDFRGGVKELEIDPDRMTLDARPENNRLILEDG
ncbi:MAG: M1 family metallopeptidase [Planctomycetota bacterium]